MSSKNKDKIKHPVRWSRIVGYALIIFGVLNFVDLTNPVPIPTIGVFAIITGIVSILGGIFILIPNKMSVVRRITEHWKKTAPQRPLSDPLIPVKILKLARQHNGILTLSDVAIELNIPLEEAEAGLDACIRSGQALADFDMTRETTFYRFHEYLPPTNPDI
jgi:hypothetical protein